MISSFQIPALLTRCIDKRKGELFFEYFPVDLCNRVEIDFLNNHKVQIEKISGFKISTNHENIIYKGIKALLRSKANSYGVHIKVEQNIPAYAGLNSELLTTATLLLALNKKWDFDLSNNDLISLSASVHLRLPSIIKTLIKSPSIDEQAVLLVKPKYIELSEFWMQSQIKISSQTPEEVVEQYFPDISHWLNIFRNHQLNAGLSGFGPMVYACSDQSAELEKLIIQLKPKADFIYIGKACQFTEIRL